MCTNDACASVLQFAAQTGRLDFLSATLAVLAIILGVGAFPVFFFVQRRAEKVARDEVKEVLQGAVKRIEEEMISKVEAMLPTLYSEYAEMARRQATGDEANAIAAAQDNGGLR